INEVLDFWCLISFSSMISTSTMYRKRTETIGNEVAAVQVLLQDEKKCRLHWVDNYARFVKGNCLWYNQDVLKATLDGTWVQESIPKTILLWQCLRSRFFSLRSQ